MTQSLCSSRFISGSIGIAGCGIGFQGGPPGGTEIFFEQSSSRSQVASLMWDYSQGHIRVRFFYLHKSLEELKIAIGTVEPVKRGMAFFAFSGFKLC